MENVMKDMPVGVFNNIFLILCKTEPSDKDLCYVVKNSEVMRNQFAKKILNNPNPENDSIICVMKYCNKSLQEKAAEIFIKNTPTKDVTPWCTALNKANNNSTREILWKKFDVANMSVEKLLIVLDKIEMGDYRYEIENSLLEYEFTEEALVKIIGVLTGERKKRATNLFCEKNPFKVNIIKVLKSVVSRRDNYDEYNYPGEENLVKMLLAARTKDTDSTRFIMHNCPEYRPIASMILINSRELTLYDLSFLMKHYKGDIIIKALNSIGSLNLDELKKIRPLIKFLDIKVRVKFIILTLMAILKISKTKKVTG